MKRSNVSLDEIVDWDNLILATHQAAKGKRDRCQVQEFLVDLERELERMRGEILDGSVRVGDSTRFEIFDPKPRVIHAPVFRERVLHHAIMRQVGRVLDRSLVDDTFACRVGKGSLAAVYRARHHSRRFSWCGKLDVRSYFASIDHVVLRALLAGRLKDQGVLSLLGRVIDAHGVNGRGLPIGALTSQCFANFYLGGLDRHLLEQCRVRGIVRYMDDVVWWCDSRREAVGVGRAAGAYLDRELHLELKERVHINRSEAGLSFCGYRLFPGTILLSSRRRKLYGEGRKGWEGRFARGEIDAAALQQGYASVLAMTLHADAVSWRREQLRRRPMLEAVEDV